MKTSLKYIPYILFAILSFAFTALPFQDLPNLLYQGKVFASIVLHGNDFGGYFILQPYIPPNVISTFIFAVFTAIFTTIFSAKLYIFLLAVSLYSGCVRYMRYHSALSEVSIYIIAFLLTCNLHFVSAYLNFMTGIAFVLHAIVTIRQRHLENNIYALAISFAIAYLCHFFALFTFGFYFITFYLYEKRHRDINRFAISFIPAFILFVHYLTNKTLTSVNPVASELPLWAKLKWKLLIFFTPIIPFHQFKWVIDTPQSLEWMNYLFCAIISLFIPCIVYKFIRGENFSFVFWLFVTSFITIIVLPAYLSGNMLPGERIVLFSMLNGFALLPTLGVHTLLKNATLIMGILLCVGVYSHIIYNTAVFNEMISEGNIPHDAIENSISKREGTNGFLHFHYYQDIERHNPSPIFTTGILTYRGANPATPDGR